MYIDEDTDQKLLHKVISSKPHTGPQIMVCTGCSFLITQLKHVMCTQKNCLNEKVLLSNQNKLKLMGKKLIRILHKKIPYQSLLHIDLINVAYLTARAFIRSS